ncbi:MAG: membrane protein [Chloroflexi bacterium]|nr:membrane protein [Chloroflexota bacterium]
MLSLRARMSRGALARFLVRLLVTTTGLFVFAVGVVLNLRSGSGLSPWQALHFGLTLHTPLSFGQASQVVGLVMLLAAWAAGVRPGLATIMNAVLVGLFTDLLLASGFIPHQELGLSGLLMLLLSLVASGLGIAVYIRGGLGAGPRDGFMLALMRLTGRGASPVRIGIEVGATVGGLLLGAPLGIGTILFALGLGPSVGFWFKVLGVKPPAKRQPAPQRT